MGVDVDSKEELENFASALTPIQNGHLKYLFIMNSMVLHFDTDVPYDELKLFMAELCKEYNFFYILQEFPDKMSCNLGDDDAKYLFDFNYDVEPKSDEEIEFDFSVILEEDDDDDEIDNDLVQMLKNKYKVSQHEPTLDEILDKITQKGVSSLSFQEQAILKNYN
jgi:hypothetical protein